MLCVGWKYALVPIPGVYILPCVVQYAWFVSTGCVVKLDGYQDAEKQMSVGLVLLLTLVPYLLPEKVLNKLSLACCGTFHDFLVFWA